MIDAEEKNIQYDGDSINLRAARLPDPVIYPGSPGRATPVPVNALKEM
jgi:hypothetical protein